MIVMPACSSGWFWHCLARETGRLGHLFSPRAQRGPWPWLPYALDNGAFSCWEPVSNTFDSEKWQANEHYWRQLLFWAQAAPFPARWAIVPDVPGNADATIAQWGKYAAEVIAARIPLAIAVQDGMTPEQVRRLTPKAEVIAIGGSTEWKWATVEMWAAEFPRVHLLRCNAPGKLQYLHDLGIESTDGTGWNRGDRKQTAGLEGWCRANATPALSPLWPHVCRQAKDRNQTTFA
jgi:hypothetical protein